MTKITEYEKKNQISNHWVQFWLKGEMHKKAYEHIWLPFFQFSTDFNETLSKCFFFQGRLNGTIKSDLTPHTEEEKMSEKGSNFNVFLLVQTHSIKNRIQPFS